MSVREHYVYIHIRPDTGAVFYVGKGSARRPGSRERAYAKKPRNKYWHNIVSKAGLEVEIVAEYENNKEALATEQRLIKFFSRKNLSNMTDGGEGTIGMEVSDELRRKRSVNSSGPRSQEWVAAIRRARKNGGNGGVVKKGDKLPDWWRDRISDAVKGENNHMYGRTGDRHPVSRAVVCTVTGERYPSISAAAEARGIKMKSLYNKLTGHRKNETGLVFEVNHAS